MGKLCPFNGFSPCKGEECAASIKAGDTPVCSLTMIANELFVLADLNLQQAEELPLMGEQEQPDQPNAE